MASHGLVFHFTHVVGQAGKAQQAALLVQDVIDLFHRPAQLAMQVGMQAGVHVAAAGAHHQAFQRGKAHAGIQALVVPHGAGGAAVAQVSGKPAACATAAQLASALANKGVAGTVETVAANAVLGIQRFRQCIAIGAGRQRLVERRIEHGHLRQVRKHLTSRGNAR